jgi:hypothetical protein
MGKSRLVLKFSVAATVIATAVLAFGTGAAIAAPHFASASGAVNSSGALVVSFDERGLGNENIDYSLTADATALYACINKGGKNPSAANKQSFEGQVSGGASFEPKNGRVQASIAVGPLAAPQFTCPSGQSRQLAQVTYSNIVLTDTTNDEAITIPDASRCLLPDIPGLCTV